MIEIRDTEMIKILNYLLVSIEFVNDYEKLDRIIELSMELRRRCFGKIIPICECGGKKR